MSTQYSTQMFFLVSFIYVLFFFIHFFKDLFSITYDCFSEQTFSPFHAVLFLLILFYL